MGRAARLGRPVVADEDQLAAQVEEPVGGEELHARQRTAPDSELVARGRGQRLQFRVREHGAGVVAMKAGPEVGEEFGVEPGSENQVGLDVWTRLRDLARLERLAGVDVLGAVKEKNVAARAGDQAHLVQRHELELHER